MAKVSIPIPSLLGGVSQQAPQLRLVGQAESQTNFYPSLVDGLCRRHPVDHVATLDDMGGDVVYPPFDSMVHIIDRDPDERYLVLFDTGLDDGVDKVRVFELADGTPIPVLGPLGAVPDFAYLEFDPPLFPDVIPAANRAVKPVTIADYTLVLNRFKNVLLSPTMTGGDPSDHEGFLFVRAGNYSTTYTAWLTQNATEYMVSVTTWDGTGAAGPGEIASIDTTDIAAALLVEILALPGAPFAGSTQVGPVVHIVSAAPDQFAALRVEDARSGLDLIKVHHSIDAVDKLPLLGVDGFTIRIDGGTAGTADDHYATFHLDGTGTDTDEWELTITGTGQTGHVWSVTIDGEEATYVRQSGDTIDDVALNLQLLIDGFTSIGATVLGSTITITQDNPGIAFTPVVSSGGNGTFTLTHTASGIGDFGLGKWGEGRGFDIPVGLEPTTMPYRLIRRQDDDAGTITGTPFAKWFEWSPGVWDERQVGDQDLAPDPSFTPLPSEDGGTIEFSTLSDMFFFRNRLGFTSSQNVVMSEVNRFFNLYRTTVISLPDGDPIDITVPSKSVVRINRAAEFNRKLILFADNAQYALDGDPILTPQTVQSSAAAHHLADADTDPLAVGDGIYLASGRGNFSGVGRLFPSRNIEGDLESEDTTIAVPQYIPGRIIQFASVESEGLLVVLAEDDRRALYLYKTFRSGDQRLQTAWFRYDLGEDATIQGFGVVGNTLHLVVHRNFGAHLERSLIQSDSVDDGADYLTHLDRRLQFDAGTYSNITGRTTWTVPYRATLFAEPYFMVVRSTTGLDGGDVYPLTRDSATNTTSVFSAQGNHAAEPVWIGQEFVSRYEFSKLYLKTDAPAGGQALRTGGRLQVLHGSVVYERTASLSVEVTPIHRTTRANMAFEGMAVSEALLGEVTFPQKEFRFPVMARDAVVEIVAAGPLPCAIQAAQFEADWAPRMGLYRGG